MSAPTSLTRLPPGVWLLRIVAPIGILLGATQVLLHLPWPGLRQSATTTATWSIIGGLQVLAWAAQMWFSWRRPPMTRVDGGGLWIRTGMMGRAERVTWAQIDAVVPAIGRPGGLRLIDGRTLALPGLTRQDSLWLEQLLASVRGQA